MTRDVEVEVVVTATPDPNASAQTSQAAPPTSSGAPAASTPRPDAPSPTPPPAAQAPASATDVSENVYQLGISADMTTTNYWAYLGPDGTIWNLYVLGGSKPSLYSYSAQRYDWVPSLASDFPTPLAEETVGGQTLWTTEVPLKQGSEMERRQRRHCRGFRLHRAYRRRPGALRQLAVHSRSRILRPCGGAGSSTGSKSTSSRSRDWRAGSSEWPSCPSSREPTGIPS